MKTEEPETTKAMKQHIQEYFNEKSEQVGSELFRINDGDSDIKSELSENEIRLINILKANDQFLEKQNLLPVFRIYYNNFLRLKVSLERKSRREYVDINKSDNSDETISKLSNISSLGGNK